jgi:hypothetical protein
MKALFIRSLLLGVMAAGLTACQNTKPTRSEVSRSPDDRPFNIQKREFEDPTPPKHRTSPGDAAR